MSEDRVMPAIDISKHGTKVSGVLIEPLTIQGLVRVLGEPRYLSMDDGTAAAAGKAHTVWVIWDDLGLRAASQDGESTEGLYVMLCHDERRAEQPGGHPRPWFPRGTYSGEYTVNGKPPLDAIPVPELRKAYRMVSGVVGDWELTFSLNVTELAELHAMDFKERFAKLETDELADMVRAARQPFSELLASYSSQQPVRKPRKPSGKWELPEPTEPVLELKSFPFRLAIIEELMFSQNLLEPRFDVHDFSQDRGSKNFDPDGYFHEMIPSVRTWFRKYPIPVRLAGNVEELVLDGGNDIYLQLIPQWDGEDERFTIPSLGDADLAPFLNLKRVRDIAGFLGPRARKALESRGVEIT